MDSVYLQEAFKKLDMLNEEDFNLSSSDSTAELNDFLSNSDTGDDMFVDVIDPQAETSDDLKDNYVGKVIIDCEVCHSKIYKNPEEVIIDEESGLANIDEECPFCYSMDGYKIIGEVAPYSEDATSEDDVAVTDSVEDTDSESALDEGVGGAIAGAVLGQALGKRLMPLGGGLAGGIAGAKIGSDIGDALKTKFNVGSDTNKPSIDGIKDIIDSNTDFFDRPGFSGSRSNEELEEKKDSCCPWCGNDPCTCEEQLKEGFEKVDIETDNEIMSMTADDNGKVTVTTEPKDSGVIVPVSDEIQAQINPISDDQEIPEEEVDFSEFSENEFDELGEAFLKKNYSNVTGYRTTSAKMVNEKLMIEGIISFDSGKQKKTSFMFESKDVTKRGLYRLIGENLQISNGKKSFTITGKLNEGKFITESFNYNYRHLNENGEKIRLYGTLRTNKK